MNIVNTKTPCTMKTKIILTVFALLLAGGTTFAQDKIIKRTGKIIECKVNEIENELIKYQISDYGDVVLSIKKSQVEKVIFANGSEYVVDHAEMASESTESNSADLFLIQRKMALKMELLGPIYNELSFSFEKAIKPSRSWEIGAALIGPGFNAWDDAWGFHVKGGYKFMRSPDHYLKGMRYAHILKGSYIRPEIAFATYSGTSKFWDSALMDESERDYTRTKAAILISAGKQIVYDDILIVDMYAGIGYGFTNMDNDVYSYDEFQHGFLVTPEVPLSFSYGFRIGILLGKKYQAE